MADNRNVRLAPSLSPKDVVATQRTTPAITLASGMPCFFSSKNAFFDHFHAWPSEGRQKHTRKVREKHANQALGLVQKNRQTLKIPMNQSLKR